MSTTVPSPPNTNLKSGLAITSLVLGIVSILACGLGILCAIPAIITGHVAHGRARRLPAQFGGGGLAIAGFVMGYVSLFFTLLIMPALLLPALSQAKGKAERMKCAHNLRSVSVGARLWAEDHNGRFPSDFLSLENELGNPKILVCPSDKYCKPALNWSSLGSANISYLIVSPGTTRRDPSTVFARCPIHGSEAYVDGSVQMKATPPRR
jgi:Domain of unknown function (DUF4190)